MTVMEQALKEAGVATRTIPERVWHYVKDHGGTACFDIAVDLKMPFDRVATVAGLLVKRKMLEVRQESRRVHGSKGTMRYINVYSVPRSMTFYTVLPLPKAGKVAKPVAPLAVVQPCPTPAPVVEKPKFDLDSLTLREAKSLYDQLKRLFDK